MRQRRFRSIVPPALVFLGVATPLARALGTEAVQKINQQLIATTDTLENTVMRLVPELSYTTLKPMTSK